MNGLSAFIDRYVPYILIIWLTLAALISHLGPLRTLYQLNTYALLPVTLIILLPRLKRQDPHAFRPGLMDYALVVFAALAIASILFGGESFAAMPQQLKALWRAYLAPFALFWIARITRPGEKQLSACVQILAGLCILEVMVGAAGLFRPDILPRFWPSFTNAMGGVRITGTLTQPDSFAAILVFTASVCFYFFSARPGRSARVLGCGLLILGFSAVFASFSRASWLGGLLVLAIIAVFYRARMIVPVLAIALMVVGISHIPASSARIRMEKDSAGITPTASPSQTLPTHADEKSYAMNRMGNKWTISDRIVLGAAGLNAFRQKPLFGWGFGSYDLHARGLVKKIGPFEPSDWALTAGASHNSHISILAELGLIGYACFSFPLVYILMRSVQAFRRFTVDGLLVTLWANLAFLALVSILIDLRFLYCISGLAGLVLGLIAVRLEHHEQPC
jgi:O-antigen ligase